MSSMEKLAAILAVVGALSAGGCNRSVEPPPQRFLDVDAGGNRLHLLVVGEAGPTVVLESGWPGCGLGWDRVRGPVAQFARVVTYDRAGTGKSDPGPAPRHAGQIATELHTALTNAGLPPPYVLVGQSLGGPYVRVFAAMFPEEVSGIVLVDPTQPEDSEPVADIRAWLSVQAPDQLARVDAALAQMQPPGYERLVASEFKRLEQRLAELPEPHRDRSRREWWGAFERSLPAGQSMMTSISEGARDEMEALAETFRQAIAARLPEVPIIVLTAGRIAMATQQAMSPLTRELHDETLRAWTTGHRHWVDKTPGAKLIVVQTSGHNIQSEQPQLVVDAIREVVQLAVASSRGSGFWSPAPSRQ